MEKSAQHWTKSPWLGFDTETTGISTANDRLVTAACLLRLGGTLATDPDQETTWLVDPGIEIPAAASAVHGISTQYARDHGQDPVAALEEICQTLYGHLSLGYPLVIFNAGYDLPLLDADCIRNGVTSLSQRFDGSVPGIIDPLVLDRTLVKFRRGRRTLSDLCKAYGVEVSDNAHQADVDTKMTLDLLTAMISEHPRLNDFTLEEMQPIQREAHAAWARDLEQWHQSQGRNRRISHTWF